MMSQTQKQSKQWEHRRKSTTLIFAIESVVMGMEYSVTFLTLWLYIKYLVKPDHPKVYYGVISACYMFTSILSSLIVASFVDRYRRVKTVFLSVNVIVIIGNIIYALPFSPWILIGGRLISGLAGALRPVISGELARCYPSEELPSKFAVIGASFATGFIIGPGINFAFKSCNFWIGGWHITYENIPGLYMAALYFIVEIMCLFMVFDVSREYDLKADRYEQIEVNRRKSTDNTIETGNPNSTENSPLLTNKITSPSVMSVCKTLLHDIDTTLVIALSFFSMYLIVSIDMWLPLLIIDTMDLTIVEMNFIVLGSGSASVAFVLLVIIKKPSDRQVFVLALIAMVAYVLLNIYFITLYIYHGHIAYNIFMCVIFAVSFSVVTIAEEVFLIGCMAKLVSSRIQTISESIRLSMNRIGTVPALLTAALVFQWIYIIGCVYIVICIIFFILLILRRKILSRPSIKLY